MVERWILGASLLILVAAPVPARAEALGQVARLPDEPGVHRVWLGDLILERTALFDADSGRFLGMLNGGTGIVAPNFSPDRREIYLAETHYSRGTRGTRTDVVTIYDALSLAAVAEVVIPPKRADFVHWMASSALSDDGRFLAVFNLTPATSLSIVDVEERRFVGEIAAPGCSLVYAAGPRRFAMLCGDGSLLVIGLDERGREIHKKRSTPFFEPFEDPVTEKAVRIGDRWLFVSFDGIVHPVDVSQQTPRFEPSWSLVDEDDRARSWRIGGAQHLAVHERSGRLYSLMHQGGPDSHKQPGSEIWVYDIAEQRRVQRIEVGNPMAALARQTLDLEPGGIAAGLLAWLLPNPGVDRILVSQDDSPLLFSGTTFPPALMVNDAISGEYLSDFSEPGIAGAVLQIP